MFDIAWSELLLIAVVALIFIGPKELPAVLHKLGMMTAKLRRAADDFRRQFEDSMRESGYGDLQILKFALLALKLMSCSQFAGAPASRIVDHREFRGRGRCVVPPSLFLP